MEQPYKKRKITTTCPPLPPQYISKTYKKKVVHCNNLKLRTSRKCYTDWFDDIISAILK